MNPRNTPLTIEEKEEIKKVYLKVGNQKIVSDITHHSITTVHKTLKVYGLCRGKGGNQEKQRKITDEQLLECVKTMTTQEIAKKYSIHETNVLRRCKKLGVRPKGSLKQAEVLSQYWGKHNKNLKNAGGTYNGCWHYVPSQALSFNKKHPNFEYLETKNDNHTVRIRLKCKKCGAVIERASATVRQKNISCDHCKKQQKKEKELFEKRVELTRFFIALKELKTPKKCKCCGMEFYSENPAKIYCSSKCKQKAKGKQSNYRERCKKYGVHYDSTVTLKKIIARDKNICQICGKPCDTKSLEWGSLGAKYPTIDHIIALKNGGTHTWDNVQLAHALCNSYKRDLDDPMDIKEAVSNAKIQTA